MACANPPTIHSGIAINLLMFAFACISIHASHAYKLRNLVPNPSFERTVDGIPKGWRWHEGRAKATLTIETSFARTGRRCIKIVNHAPFQPHVYSYLATNIPVKPNTVYTLSCYVRSADPGRAWIGGGERWRIRFHFKPTGNKWMRIVGTFKTNPTERNFYLMILTESPTSGIWIDDVQLEEGDKVTAFQMPIKLKSGDVHIVVERAHVNPNLVPNSSFEEVHGNRPHHWMWDRRNTDATMTVDETIARSGKCSIKLTNGTPFGAHVYGWFGLVGSIPVKPNTAYTVSCYVRTEGAGIAWIGGGKRWRIRAMFPRVTTGGRWVRVWKSFVTEPDEKTFALMIVTESPTKGIWIDDVKFEEGDRPTPYVPDFEKPHPSLELELPPPKSVEHRGILFMPIWKPERYPIHEHVFAGEQVWLEGLLYLPKRLGRAQLRVLIERTDTGEVVKRAMHEYDFDAGAYDVEIGWGCADADLARYRIRAWLEPVASEESANVTATGQRKNILASAQLEFYLYSRRTVLAQIEKVRRMLAQLDDAIAKLQRRGEDTSYPQVTASIVRDFIGYALEDVNYGEVGRAWDAGVVMERLLRDELAQIENVLKGKAHLPRAVRFVTSRVEIRGTSFIADAMWRDKDGGIHRERRPVFFVGYGHFGQVRRDVEKFPRYGINIIQIEFGPNSVFPAEGEVSNTAVENFLRVCDRSAKAGVQVNLLISPHYFPGWMLEKYPHLRACEGGFIKFCIDAPESRQLLERYLRHIIPQIKNHPALHSICLTNEPIYVDSRKCKFTLAQWHRWLRKRHGDIATLNRRWRTGYSSFDDIEIPKPHVEPKPIYYDWAMFNMERFAGWHRWMADIIHEIAPNLPVHAKIMMWMPFNRRDVIHGVDPQLFGELSQINGNDCAKWYARHGEWASSWLTENMAYDLQCSVADKPVFNSENHLIIDRDFGDIPPEHIRNVLWQGAIHGQGATTIWVWERTFSPTSDFAGSIMHRPECAVEVGKTCLDLNRLAHEVSAIQRLAPQIVLVHSWASMVYSNAHADVLKRTYTGLNFLGIKLGFVTERQLERFAKSGKLPLSLRAARVIVVPNVTHTPDVAVRALAQLATKGFNIVFVGDKSLMRDEYDNQRKSLPFEPLFTLPSDIKPKELWKWFEGHIAQLGIHRNVILCDAEGEPIWGVEYLVAQLGDRVLLNLCNYLRTPQRVVIVQNGQRTRALNLLTGEPVAGALHLAPLEPALIEIR